MNITPSDLINTKRELDRLWYAIDALELCAEDQQNIVKRLNAIDEGLNMAFGSLWTDAKNRADGGSR